VAATDGQGFESFHVLDADGWDLQISNGNGLTKSRRTPAHGSLSAPAPFAATGWKTVWLDHLSFSASNYKESTSFYEALLGWSLVHRLIVLLVALATLVLGVYLIAAGHVGINFFPETDQGTLTVSTTMPPGTTLAAHDAVMREVEGQLLEIPEISNGILSASIGAGSGGPLTAFIESGIGREAVCIRSPRNIPARPCRDIFNQRSKNTS